MMLGACVEMLLAAGLVQAGSVRVPIENIILPKGCNMDDAMQCDFLNEIMMRKNSRKDECEDGWPKGKKKMKESDIMNALIGSGLVTSSMMAPFDSFLKNTLRCDMNSIPRTQGDGMFGNICNNSSIYPSLSPQMKPPISIGGSFPPYCQGFQDPRCINRNAPVVRTETIYVPVPAHASSIYPPTSSRAMPYPMPYPYPPVQPQLPPQQYYPQGIPRGGCQQMPWWPAYPPQGTVPGGSYFPGGDRVIDNMAQAGMGRCIENKRKNKTRKRKKKIVIKCVCIQARGGLEDCKCSEAD